MCTLWSRRMLEDDADIDEDIAKVMEGTDGDPDRIRENVRGEGDTVTVTVIMRTRHHLRCNAVLPLVTYKLSFPLPQMRFQMENKDMYVIREGSDELPTIAFRQINPFRLWVWIEFNQPPSAKDQELLESVVKAWFMLGKLGGYNSGNLQVN